MPGKSGRVFVFGSANQDLVFSVHALPSAGETVLSDSFDCGLGGKGANQAVAAAMCGAHVTFVGSVGADDAGEAIVANLNERGIYTGWLERHPGLASGLAVVMVDHRGRNQIVVAPGANSDLGLATIAAALEEVEAADIVVVQCEIPSDRVEAILTAAAAKAATTLLNLAPPIALASDKLALASVLIVNESEARTLVPHKVTDHEELAVAVSAATGTACLVTLGSRGSHYCGQDGGQIVVAAERVSGVVDTTGAGDTYVGTLAAQLAQGGEVRTAMQAASRAAALSVANRGAQSSASPSPGVQFSSESKAR